MIKPTVVKICCKLSYRIAQFFDAENIDGFDAKLAIHQNFPFQ